MSMVENLAYRCLLRTGMILSLTAIVLLASCAGTAPHGASSQPEGSGRGSAGEAEQSDLPGATGRKEPVGSDERAEGGVFGADRRRGLSTAEIFKRSRNTVPDRFLFIEEGGTEDGTPVVLFHDLDDNGYRDALFLLVERSPSLLTDAMLDKKMENGGLGEEDDSSGIGPSGDVSYEDGSPRGENTEAPGENTESPGQNTEAPGENTESRRERLRRELLESWYEAGRVPEEALSSVSRIYSEGKGPLDYYLSVFLQAEDELISMYRIPLGAWKVFENFSSVQIVERAQMPYCVSSSFQTAEGRERSWVIFSRYNKFSTFTLTDTVSDHNEVRDIDGDGKLDVVVWDQIFEEGTGYETFLNWYRWDDGKYVQHKTANVVRSLNDFLLNAARLLQAGAWDEAFSHMMSPADYRAVRREDYTYGRLFSLLFSEAPEEDYERAPDSGDSAAEDPDPQEKRAPSTLIDEEVDGRAFKMVVFPRVMENPFRRYVESGKGPPYRVRLSVRFSAGKDRVFVRRCVVQMHENPFEPPQFFLVPNY